VVVKVIYEKCPTLSAPFGEGESGSFGEEIKLII